MHIAGSLKFLHKSQQFKKLRQLYKQFGQSAPITSFASHRQNSASRPAPEIRLPGADFQQYIASELNPLGLIQTFQSEVLTIR